MSISVASEDRPQYQSGVGTINGTTFHWGSGTPGKYWSVPYGDYPVTPNAPVGAWARGVGAIPIANNIIPDPVLHRNRVGIMIHPSSSQSLDHLYTQGCFAVAPSEWPAVKAQILAEAQKGPLYLHVQPGQAAAFTHEPTLKQAGAPPASQSPPGTTIAASNAPVAGALAKPAAPSFFDSLAQIESNNQNVYSRVDKDVAGPNTRSQGYFQINTPTWQQFGAQAGIDLTKYPNAMSAPREVQQQVAALIPFSRFGPRTQKMLNQQFGGNLDTKATIGALASSTGASTPTTSTAAAPATAPAAPQTLLGKLTSKQTDPKTGKTTDSPLQQVAEAFSPSADGAKSAKEFFEEQAPERSMLSGGPGARNVSPGLMNIAQTYGQTLNSFNQPLTWNAAAPRLAGMAPAGFQPPVPGVSLNSVQPPSQELGYGIEPIGYGYG